METYKWHTPEAHNNNTETMDDYLENHLIHEFWECIFQDGTYAEIQNKYTGAIWAVHASGDGDFCNHKVEFEFVH